MMDRREALLLAKRLKRRTRDPDVLTLCELSTGRMSTGQSRDFGGRVTGHRRLCFRLPYARCARHVGRQRRRGKKDGAMGAETDADVAARQPCPGVAPEVRCSRCCGTALPRVGRGTGLGRPILWRLRDRPED